MDVVVEPSDAGGRSERYAYGGGMDADAARSLPPFDELVTTGEEADISGWDFSWLDGRATEERPPWGYARLLAERLALAHASLDVQTGGGEVLAQAEAFPPTAVATESWPPNIEKA